MSDKNGLEPARGLDPWRWPNGSQPLGTRMLFSEKNLAEKKSKKKTKENNAIRV